MTSTFSHQLPSGTKTALTVSKFQGGSDTLLRFSLEETLPSASSTINAIGYFPFGEAADIAAALLRESGVTGDPVVGDNFRNTLYLMDKLPSEELFRLAAHALDKGVIVRAKEFKDKANRQAREDLARILWEAGAPQPDKTPWDELADVLRDRWLDKADAALAHINRTNEK